MVGDDAEVREDKEQALAKAAENQRIINERAYELHHKLCVELASIDKQRRGLKPKALYFGTEEYNYLRAWSQGLSQWQISPDFLAYMGYPFFVVRDKNHLYVAWE